MLINMMDTKLYETRGNTLNNFSLSLPKEDSECVKEILKDEYKLDFLVLRENYEEKDLHNGLWKIQMNQSEFLLMIYKMFCQAKKKLQKIFRKSKCFAKK